MHKFVFSAALAALSLPCLAQDYIGLTYNTSVSATSRGSLGTNAGEVMTRIDGSEFAGWGTNTPGFRTIGALYYIVQDQDALTPEVFDIKLYPEDVSNPGYPDLAAGVVYATGITGPTTTGTVPVIAATVKITPPTTVGVGDSVPIQGGGDVFVSWVLPANAGWAATDGLSINIILGFNPSTFTVYDTPGLAQGGTPAPSTALSNPSNSHGLYRIGAGLAAYSQRRMMLLDVLHSTSGGTALGITNQTTYLGSNNPPPAGFGPAPGTASMMSGSNPDVVGGNLGRVDDLAMEFYRTGFGTGGLVVFLADFGNFGPELPMAALGVNGTGVLCLNLSSLMVLGISFSVTDEAYLVSLIPAGARSSLAGLPIVQQAGGLDAAGGVHASPCRRQVL